jgi:hypothetical protein
MVIARSEQSPRAVASARDAVEQLTTRLLGVAAGGAWPPAPPLHAKNQTPFI